MTLPKTQKELQQLLKKLNCKVNELKIALYKQALRKYDKS